MLALLASSVGDPEGTRTITSIVLLLVVLGIALVMLAFWLFRLTRPDKELLAPLEVMGERKWRRADPVWQRRRLDEVRPADAQPLQPSAAPPQFDEAFFEYRPAAAGFEDLHDTAHANGESSRHEVGPVAADAPAVDGDTASDAPVAPAALANGVVAPPAGGDNRDGERAAAEPAPPAPPIKPVSPTPTGI